MTTLKTLTIAATIALLPGMTLAMGCNSSKHQQAQSCATGTAWDSASQTCIPTASS